MSSPSWQSIPLTTRVHDLFWTSLLIFSPDATSGILARFSPGLEEGSATAVLATTSRLNALGMIGIDDDAQVGEQAQALLGVKNLDVMAIPHITWKSVGKGHPWRTPIVAVVALITAVLMYLPPLSWSLWVIIPDTAFLGFIMWLLLRERIPTRVGPPDAPPMTADEVMKRAMSSHVGVEPLRSSVVRLPKGSRRWAPPVN